MSDVPSSLKALLMERSLTAAANPVRVVGYLDMLGFGALVRKHPSSFNVDVSEDGSDVSTSTSPSSQRFIRFHAVLDGLAGDFANAAHPERMMIFSDCAFCIFDNSLQASVSMADMMRRFLAFQVPVRMCIAKGTCHYERFSIESFNTFNLTRSMFYGSGIVSAVKGESETAPGCRIFLHDSLDDDDLQKIKGRLDILPMDPPAKHVKYELNYLNEHDGTETPAKDDLDLYHGLLRLKGELRDPIPAEVLAHYDESFALFNRMRERFSRHKMLAPRFDGQGNYIDPRTYMDVKQVE